MKMHEARSLEHANLKLAEMIAADFRDYVYDDLVFGALPVTLSPDGKRIATAVFAYPRGDVERTVGCVWPPVSEMSKR